MTTKEDVKSSLVRFVREFGRYPTRQETREFDYLYSQQTVNRYLGLQSNLGILEEVYAENPCKCLECGSNIPFDKRNSNKFCGRSCAGTYNNRVYPKRQPTSKELYYKDVKQKKIIYCLYCNTSLKSHQEKFCSLNCSAKHKQLQRMDDWLSGNLTVAENKTLRNFLKILDGDRCSVCGIEHWNDKPITFEVEHKDGNSEDSSRENVCLICPNCHSQTDTYKGKNKGNGRHNRMQRYYEGKSY